MIPRLVVITPNTLQDDPQLVDKLAQLAQDPRIALLIREPSATISDLQTLFAALANANAQLICHAKTPGCEAWLQQNPHGGAHLPESADPGLWRSKVNGPLGQSTHSLESAQNAFANGVDYVTLSPIFAPRSKPLDKRPLVSLKTLAKANELGPTLALGGVNTTRFKALRSQGLWGGAVLGSIFADDESIDGYF